MRTISLYQPWASAMALGLKKIETRGTRILGRGPTAIHAAKKWDEDLEYDAADFSRLFNTPGLIDAPRGYIIAVGRIVDCVPTEELVDKISNQEQLLGNYSEGRYGWIFEDIVALDKPFPYRGQQGQWDTPDHLFPRGLV